MVYSNIHLAFQSGGIILEAMEIVCFRPRPDANLNDTLTEWGVKELLREVLGSSIHFHNIHFEPLETKEIPRHDLFVLCGTPWIWDQCTNSAKYRDLAAALAISGAPKIALGIGSCFPLNFDWDVVNQTVHSMPSLGPILKNFSSITARDRFAKKVCDLLGIKAKLLCCPAVFAKDYIGVDNKADKDIVFFYAPQFGLSGGVLSEDFTEHYMELQVDYAERVEAEVICIDENEAKIAMKLGLSAQLLRSPHEVAEKIITAKTLLSGRVHGCLFAAGMPIEAALLPVDTRMQCYEYCGGKVIMTDRVSSIGLKDLRRCRFNYAREKKRWKRFLTRSLELVGLA